MCRVISQLIFRLLAVYLKRRSAKYFIEIIFFLPYAVLIVEKEREGGKRQASDVC